MVQAAPAGITVRIDPQEWYRLKKAMDAADKSIARDLRKRIKAAGDIAAQAVRDSLKESPPAGGPDPAGFRDELQRATRVSISFGLRAAGVKVRTSSSGLPGEQKPLLAAYNKGAFRHPVFPQAGTARTSWKWVPQVGKPYFGAAIMKVIDTTIQREIMLALDAAVDAIGGRVR